MSSANTFQGMARSISARNRSRRVTLRLPANSASEKLNWLIGVFLIASHSTSYILTGSSDLFRVSLETALHQVAVSDELTSRIIKSTWMLIASEDREVFRKSLNNHAMFPLSRLIQHMFKSSLKIISIVTTNYDRLAEYACDQAGIHHYTGFTHGFFRRLAAPIESRSTRRVNIWKVHGSLDWFQSSLEDTVALSSIEGIPEIYEPQIVTPGTQKYHKTHLEPFRSIINNADAAMDAAGSYLCVGYGFNDEHIQTKLMAKCQRQSTPVTIVTYSLSESAKRLILNGKAQNYLAIERGATDDQSIIYSSQHKDPQTVEKNIWSLDGYQIGRASGRE